MEPKIAVSSLSALAQETRLAIFRRLVRAGPDGESAGALANALDIPPPTLSFHLRELERASLIVQRRAGRSLIYAANFAAMRELLVFLTEDCCAGHPEICCLTPKETSDESSACSPACA
jgi:ArsR family transcriptional regulator